MGLGAAFGAHLAGETATLRAGTVLYHGTAQSFGFRMPRSRSYFSPHPGVARRFARMHVGMTGPVFPARVHKYLVLADIELPLLRRASIDRPAARGEVYGTTTWGEFLDYVLSTVDSTDVSRFEDVLCKFFHGYWIADNYGPGADEVYLCNPKRWLRRVQAKGERFGFVG